MTSQILIRLPEEIASRFKAAIPPRQRNKFVAELVKKALAAHEAKLGKIAEEVTQEELENPELIAEDRDWNATLADGLDETREQPQSKRKSRPKAR